MKRKVAAWVSVFGLVAAGCGGTGGEGVEGGGGGGEMSAPVTPSRVAVSSSGAVGFTPEELAVIFTMSPLPAMPADPTNRVADDAGAARLGQMLFFDARLSAKGDVSCATCHEPSRSWTDGEAVPTRFKDLRNVPSLWNVGYNRWFFWDGRSDSLWSQALDPLEHPNEHAGFRGGYARLMHDDPGLRRAYEAVFGVMPDVTDAARFPTTARAGEARAGTAEDQRTVDTMFANMGKALAAYQRKIVSRRSPFDVFVEGLKSGDAGGGGAMGAMSPAAQRGLRLFIGAGNCRSCHHGPNFTDGEFHDNGVAGLDRAARPDQGRLQGINKLLSSPFNAVGEFSDDPNARTTHPTSFLVNSVERRGQFKTPTLRNVALTGPYMHRGQMKTLAEVVEFYSTLRLPGETAAQALEREAQARRSRPDAGHSHDGTEQVMTPLNLSRSEMEDLVAFLESLTDTGIDPGLMRPVGE